jgi:phosphoribosylformylglycinamidine cyclo-ligase
VGLTYRESGVDAAAGDALVERIKPLGARTIRPEVVSGIGGFGGLFEVPKKYQDPILVSGTDGVGTKLRIAFETGRHSTVGIDLVAMSVNDVLTSGAEPLFFLDYFSTSKLDISQAESVISGIARGCEQAGCTLLGGETAELPGFYAPGEYDLLEPTRIYVRDVLALRERVEIKGLAHITGGGIPGNLPRCLPDGTCAVLSERNWKRAPIFDLIASGGEVQRDEMYATFNMGLGMIAVVSKSDAAAAIRLLKDRETSAWEVGHIERSTREPCAIIEP